ncbi:nucleic acid-binding, OB-fold protein [Artemisia annua]|uniref:Nucleic acid-binding, OB-fold protein n=1 Tax=Artemisia annua TaxID=35608 RepID=A0A2U1L1X3_ARTAN|nr:nucleic acid-binding, OB-fold protein [Artemisia annua]
MADKGKQAIVHGSTSSTTQSEEYMLQRSKEKGKAPVVEPEIVNLMDLKPADLDKPIEVKVYRKWTSKNVPDPNPTGLCFILLGRDGSAIQANVQLWDMRQFDSRLQLGSCYKIEHFGYKRTENWQRTLNNPLTLLFGRYTQVVPIQDEGFPDHYFNFAAYNELGRRADTKDYTLTDYIGTIRNIGHIREFGDPTTNRILRRNVEIQNLNGNVVTFTIWNEMAADFPLHTLTQMEQPVIIAVSSCWVRRFSGGLQLSATPTTYYYLNPSVEEAGQIRQIYCFKATIADDTGSVIVTCFSPEADSLLLSTVTELLSYIPDPDPYVLPPIIRDLENTRHVFHVHVAKGSRRGFVRFILDGAEDIPLPAPPEVLPVLPEVPPHTEETESSATETPTATEIGPENLTPPPHSTEQLERERVPSEIQSTTVRRQLFEQTSTVPQPYSPEPVETETVPSEVQPAATRTELPKEASSSSPTRSVKRQKHDEHA